MTLFTVLVVLAIEFYSKWGSEHRSLRWFRLFHQKLSDKLGDKSFYEGWLGVFLVVISPVLILYFVAGLLDEGLIYAFIWFLLTCFVLFLSLGPKPLTASFETYLKAAERGDSESAYLTLQQEVRNPEVPEGEDIIRNATRHVFVESQKRYFGVLFWFIFLGPFGALLYRLTSEYYEYCMNHEEEDHADIVYELLYWLDWLPARLTSLLFLLTGDFMNGFSRVKDYLINFSASNKQMLSETGIAALGIKLGSVSEGVKENKEAIKMVERTVILYVLVVAALSPLAFW